jgi:hypothetical protein
VTTEAKASVDVSRMRGWLGDVDEAIVRVVECYAFSEGASEELQLALVRLGHVRAALQDSLGHAEQTT